MTVAHRTYDAGAIRRIIRDRALDKLYVGYEKRLACFLWRFTRCRENIEVIINDTFMVVWRNAHDFRFASQVSSSIFGIAYRTALKAIRHEKNHATAPVLGQLQEQTVDPALEIELRDWLRHGLDRVSADQGLALQLACHMGHSLVEVADITGVPVGTVKARMFHARQKLRRHLPVLARGIHELSEERVQRRAQSAHNE